MLSSAEYKESLSAKPSDSKAATTKSTKRKRGTEEAAAAAVPTSASAPAAAAAALPAATSSTSLSEQLAAADAALLQRWAAPATLHSGDAHEQTALDSLLALAVYIGAQPLAATHTTSTAASAAAQTPKAAVSDEAAAVRARKQFVSVFDAYLAARESSASSASASASASEHKSKAPAAAGSARAVLFSHNFLVRVANRCVDVAVQDLTHRLPSASASKPSKKAEALQLWAPLKVLIDSNALSARACPNLIPTLLVYKQMVCIDCVCSALLISCFVFVCCALIM